MIFKPFLSKILPKAPKNRLIFTLVAAQLVNLGIGLFYIFWQNYVFENKLGETAARSYDLTMVTTYIFVTSVTYYALQDWVFADGEGCYTLQLVNDAEKTWLTQWLVRFCSWPPFCLTCFYANYTLLTVGSWEEIHHFRGAFLSGAVMVLVDLACEMKGCSPAPFLHHVVAMVSILLSAEWGHFEPAILLFGLQLAMDKLVWPIFFFSRLMILRERLLKEAQDGSLHKNIKVSTVELLASPELATKTVSTTVLSSCGCSESATSTSTPSEANEPFALPVTQEEDAHAAVEIAHHDANSTPSTAEPIELQQQEEDDAANKKDVEEAGSSPSSSASSACITIPDEAIFKKLKVIQVYQESHKNGTVSSWYVDDLIPSPTTMAYLYSGMFVYYVWIVRILTLGSVAGYLIRFWDHVELPWKIMLMVASLLFAGIDSPVYQATWLRSHWGRIGRARIAKAREQQ